MTRLSEHFSLEEFLVTQVRDTDNQPSGPSREKILSNLLSTAQRMEEIRSLLGHRAVIVTSGYRSALVNKIVGGSPSSAHMRGIACDFICPSFGSPYDVCRAIAGCDLDFDQLIFEESWVHLSFDSRMRREVLTKRRHGTYVSGLKE